MRRLLLVLILLLIFAPTVAQNELELPEGEIVFVSNRDGNDEIYIMNVDGNNQRNLTNNPARDMSPVWSPSGEWIYFLREDTVCPNSNAIYAMNSDGGMNRGITKEVCTWWLHPVNVTDEFVFIYGCLPPCETNVRTLLRIELDTGRAIALSTDDIYVNSAILLPDRQFIIFTGWVGHIIDTNSQTFIVGINGESLINLAEVSNEFSSFYTLPTGRELNFTEIPIDEEYKLEQYRLNGYEECTLSEEIIIEKDLLKEETYSVFWRNPEYLLSVTNFDGDYEILYREMPSQDWVQLTHNDYSDDQPQLNPQLRQDTPCQ